MTGTDASDNNNTYHHPGQACCESLANKELLEVQLTATLTLQMRKPGHGHMQELAEATLLEVVNRI